LARPVTDQGLPDALPLGLAHVALDDKVGGGDDLLQRAEAGEDIDAAELAVLAELPHGRLLDALADRDADNEQERAGDDPAERQQSTDLVLPQGREGEAEQVAETHEQDLETMNNEQ